MSSCLVWNRQMYSVNAFKKKIHSFRKHEAFTHNRGFPCLCLPLNFIFTFSFISPVLKSKSISEWVSGTLVLQTLRRLITKSCKTSQDLWNELLKILQTNLPSSQVTSLADAVNSVTALLLNRGQRCCNCLWKFLFRNNDNRRRRSRFRSNFVHDKKISNGEVTTTGGLASTTLSFTAMTTLDFFGRRDRRRLSYHGGCRRRRLFYPQSWLPWRQQSVWMSHEFVSQLTRQESTRPNVCFCFPCLDAWVLQSSSQVIEYLP